MQDSACTPHSLLRTLHTACCTSYIWHGQFGIISMWLRKEHEKHPCPRPEHNKKKPQQQCQVQWYVVKIRAVINSGCSYSTKGHACNCAVLQRKFQTANSRVDKNSLHRKLKVLTIKATRTVCIADSNR